MQALFKNFKEDFSKFNIISKYILKIGTSLIIGIILFALFVKAYICFFNADCYFELFFEDILECLKETFGAVYLGAFILEILHLNFLKQENK